MLKGMGVSPGVGVAPVLLLIADESKMLEPGLGTSTIEHEIKRFNEVRQLAKDELNIIKEKVLKNVGKEKADIIEIQIMFLEDPTVVDETLKLIHLGNNAAFAAHKTVEKQAQMFESIPVPEMQERAIDMRDMGRRLVDLLQGGRENRLAHIKEPVIVVAHDLTPSDTAQLNTQQVLALVTEVGSATSHTAILARTLGIPAVVGVPSLLSNINDGSILAVNGNNGELFLNPGAAIVQDFQMKAREFENEQRAMEQLVGEPAVTLNGKSVRIAANIGKLADIDATKRVGVKEIGLFRTEFLYMDRDTLPTEEEQYQAYRQVIEAFPKLVIFRTLDIGGDKELPYLPQAKELNPFLGKRAIRLTLAEKELFKTQLRSILRVSQYGNVGVMFPMIATLEELRACKDVLEEVRQELIEKAIPLNPKVQIGMMVETPAAAIAADLFAQEIDFFSIGTNDLIQYTMAADRMNEQVAYLYQPTNPAILRLIEGIAKAAHDNGIWVGMCGEMAGNPEYTEILLKMGMDELSMTRGAVLKVKAKIRSIKY